MEHAGCGDQSRSSRPILCNSNPLCGLGNRFSRLPRSNTLVGSNKISTNDSCAKSSWVVFYLPFECKQIVKGEILRCSKCFWIGRESEGFYFLAHRALNEVPWKVRTFFKFSVVGMPIFYHRKRVGIKIFQTIFAVDVYFGGFSLSITWGDMKIICEFLPRRL